MTIGIFWDGKQGRSGNWRFLTEFRKEIQWKFMICGRYLLVAHFFSVWLRAVTSMSCDQFFGWSRFISCYFLIWIQNASEALFFRSAFKDVIFGGAKHLQPEAHPTALQENLHQDGTSRLGLLKLPEIVAHIPEFAWTDSVVIQFVISCPRVEAGSNVSLIQIRFSYFDCLSTSTEMLCSRC